MKEILTKLSLTTILLIYLFCCGTIYIVAYWSTFGLDVTNYIEVMDIPKSFVFPLATSIGIGGLYFILQPIIDFHEEEDDKSNENPKKKKSFLRRKLQDLFRLDAWLIVIVTISFFAAFFDKVQWASIPFAISFTLLVMVRIDETKILERLIPHKKLGQVLGLMFFLIPCVAYITAKIKAWKLQSNIDYYTIVEVKRDGLVDTSLLTKKLIGKLGSTIFVTDSSNNNITLINEDQLETISYKFVEPEMPPRPKVKRNTAFGE